MLLEVKNLRKYFPIKGSFGKNALALIKAVDGVSFSLDEGETLGVVGESGCGKTTLGRTLLRLLEPDGGRVLLEIDGTKLDVLRANPREIHEFRKDVQVVFQDPQSSLDPRMKIAKSVAEPLELLGLVKDKGLREKRVLEVLEEVGLKPEHLERYPHEFSGGQKQRICIARAIISNPKIIVLDEPTSAVDVSVQAQILNLLKKLQKERGMGYLFISHNLSVVYQIADNIAVMYLGRIVEYGKAHRIFKNPLHPYTRALFSAIPVPDVRMRGKRERIELEGHVPSLIDPPDRCRFYDRCYEKDGEVCSNKIPELVEAEPDHMVACFRRAG